MILLGMLTCCQLTIAAIFPKLSFPYLSVHFHARSTRKCAIPLTCKHEKTKINPEDEGHQ